VKTIRLYDVIDGKTVVTHTHDPECTGCDHDCPWRRTNPAPLGAPFCSVCDDHAEAVHAGYGDVPCDCGDTHDGDPPDAKPKWWTESDDYTGPTFMEYGD
jgi:hypothetical protein